MTAAELLKQYEYNSYIDITEVDNVEEWKLIMSALRCYIDCPIDLHALEILKLNQHLTHARIALDTVTDQLEQAQHLSASLHEGHKEQP